MKIPRNCNGTDLVRALRRLGYETLRQSGSHIQLTTQLAGEHHISIPNHHPLKIGLLNALLKDVAGHHDLSVEELLQVIKL